MNDGNVREKTILDLGGSLVHLYLGQIPARSVKSATGNVVKNEIAAKATRTCHVRIPTLHSPKKVQSFIGCLLLVPLKIGGSLPFNSESKDLDSC